uniref:Uncharacterized protein n=1 Tax=Acrobeloides nanus TaxID=290746 RepID=A0A914CQT6_9BILA
MKYVYIFAVFAILAIFSDASPRLRRDEKAAPTEAEAPKTGEAIFKMKYVYIFAVFAILAVFSNASPRFRRDEQAALAPADAPKAESEKHTPSGNFTIFSCSHCENNEWGK